jgi:hypothetical protein
VLNKELEDVKNEFEDALDEIEYLNAKMEEMKYNFEVRLIQTRLEIAKKYIEEQSNVEKVLKAFDR